MIGIHLKNFFSRQPFGGSDCLFKFTMILIMYHKYNHFFPVILFLLAFFFPGKLLSQEVIVRDVKISWEDDASESTPESQLPAILSFSGSITRNEHGLLPMWAEAFRLSGPGSVTVHVRIENPVYEPLPLSPSGVYRDIEKIPDSLSFFHELLVQRKVPWIHVLLLPFRTNQVAGGVERLVSFTLLLTIEDGPKEMNGFKSAPAYAENSVLSTGLWYKFGISAGGICQLTYEDLKNAGIDVGSINPLNIRIYGNGGGMLPEANATERIDDLKENAIFVYGEADGRFDPGDYILFHGQAPDTWVYSTADHLFRHRKNIYSDQTFYFLNFDLGPGLRIPTEAASELPPTTTFRKFDDYAVYEKEELNFIKSGKEWWDKQTFELTLSRNYSFSFPNIDTETPATLTAKVAARSTYGSSSFVASIGGTALLSLYVDPTGSGYESDYAKEKLGSAQFAPAGPNIEVNLRYNKSSGSTGYLNYIEVNASRHLIQSGAQMAFRSMASVVANGVTEFILDGKGENLEIWNITTTGEVTRMATQKNGNIYTFRTETPVLKEFLAFNGSSFIKPVYAGQIGNQDLHGTAVVDYIVVSHPDFLSEAGQLADFHRQRSNLTVFITTPDKIYNEFSSGAQDITAIRDFVRMMYNKAIPGEEPRYLLLFGDASYDYKNRIQNNTNFVPAFESANSLSPEKSFVSDDYFVLLDPNEGQSANGALDMGVGRLPVASVQEAEEAIRKIFHYCANSDSVKNDWRNVVTFVADDQNEGGNMFVEDSEDLAGIVEASDKAFNIDKIYSDAYTMVSTPGGNRYPEVNDAINKRVEKGSLIMNYVGHGGELGWGHERILEVPDIKTWRNLDNLPVFVTATCEFSRYDDPERVSAGEWVFLNEKGGGIALFTTSRLTYAGTNKALLVNFYNNVFSKSGGRYLKLGDLLMAAKFQMGSYPNIHAFVLLGDPALQMDYPDLEVVTTSINGNPPTAIPDTLKALSLITISGEVRDASGQQATGFSGTLFPTVFDKAVEVWTKANYGYDSPYPFLLRKNPVYKGTVEVVDGSFSFSFIVPKDIAYKYGMGKISYYARSAETDANGYDENIQVGGYNDVADPDDQGPEIALFMNDRDFVSGGITNQAPFLLADIADSSGINTVGNGIGHDIAATLDHKSSTPIILNDYYVADMNTYKSGTLGYPLSAMTDGEHTLALKAWDVYNNSSETAISFIVVSSAEFALQHLYNYPNPMHGNTTFAWETNQVFQPVEVEIRIFTLNGDLVHVLHETIYNQGFRTACISWDGVTSSGSKIGSGMYVYRLQLMLEDGTAKYQTSKLVVVR